MQQYENLSKDAKIFLHKLALACLNKGGEGTIPPEMIRFVGSCFANGINLEIKEKQGCIMVEEK